jgi:hypothetical protein
VNGSHGKLAQWCSTLCKSEAQRLGVKHLTIAQIDSLTNDLRSALAHWKRKHSDIAKQPPRGDSLGLMLDEWRVISTPKVKTQKHPVTCLCGGKGVIQVPGEFGTTAVALCPGQTS